MNEPVVNSIPDSADHWLAYRYLTGELSDDEAATCEARLASDLSLQVALSECVMLTSGLSRLSRPPAVASTSRGVADSSVPPRRSGSWTTAAVGLFAAGLLLAAVSLTSQHAPQNLANEDGVAVLDPSSVVSLWSELADEGDSSSESREGSERFDDFGDEQLDVPDWMLVAVLDESAEADDAETPQEHQL